MFVLFVFPAHVWRSLFHVVFAKLCYDDGVRREMADGASNFGTDFVRPDGMCVSGATGIFVVQTHAFLFSRKWKFLTHAIVV